MLGILTTEVSLSMKVMLVSGYGHTPSLTMVAISLSRVFSKRAFGLAAMKSSLKP
jgi:hypothetical protein